MFRKQLCIWVLFSFCILSACGCSKQDSNSEVMEELVGENEEYDGIGIPTSYSGNLEIGEKELRINCQTISVPENMSMFCKEYKNHIKPDPKLIPKGKSCVYAEAGGELQYILSAKEL